LLLKIVDVLPNIVGSIFPRRTLIKLGHDTQDIIRSPFGGGVVSLERGKLLLKLRAAPIKSYGVVLFVAQGFLKLGDALAEFGGVVLRLVKDAVADKKPAIRVFYPLNIYFIAYWTRIAWNVRVPRLPVVLKRRRGRWEGAAGAETRITLQSWPIACI
jgi:hypothetical protein